ncbi:MAG TPA: four helix bundle protein [Xanthomonadales bacterium]|nr:four helix bundle protein [Xanthomonadales bacterium]
MVRDYKDLVAWQRGIELARAVYCLTPLFPSDERFGLSQQMRRAAVAIPSNIAEGHERRSRADYKRFVAMACGSVAEVETQLEPAVQLGFVERHAIDEAVSLCGEVGRMLRGLERALREAPAIREGAGVNVLLPQPSTLSPQP